MVKFWSDPRDIKLAILETLAEFSLREDLVGWIPGDEAVNSGTVAEEMARLAKENKILSQQVNKTKSEPTSYNGLSFNEMNELLNSIIIEVQNLSGVVNEYLGKTAKFFGNSQITLLHYLWINSRLISTHRIKTYSSEYFDKLLEFGLLQIEIDDNSRDDVWGHREFYTLSEAGKKFLLRLRVEKNLLEAENYILN